MIIRELAFQFYDDVDNLSMPERLERDNATYAIDSAHMYVLIAMKKPPPIHGILAVEKYGKVCQLTALKDECGYYLGTVDAMGNKLTHESADYFHSESQAKAAMKFGIYYQMD